MRRQRRLTFSREATNAANGCNELEENDERVRDPNDNIKSSRTRPYEDDVNLSTTGLSKVYAQLPQRDFRGTRHPLWQMAATQRS